MQATKPVILCEGTYSGKDPAGLKSQKRIWEIRDVYEAQSRELFEITHPELRLSPQFGKTTDAFVAERQKKFGPNVGNWIYFPWSGILLHTVNEEEYFSLRTNRNRNLITVEEQEKLRRFPIGIVGLSVGSHVATALTYLGMAQTMKLAEHDTLETTNLNRIRARIDQIGASKIDILTKQLYEANPYADLILFEKGLTEENLKDFVTTSPAPRLIFEIIDNFVMKIHLRVLARKARIPVMMFANLGDRILVDVERYDLDPNIPLFNGRAGKTPEEILEKPDITEAEKHRYAVDLVGIENIPERAMASVKEINKTLVGRPQLASTVTVTGGVAAFMARRLALGETLQSGRHLIRFEDAFLPNAL